jgi:DNA polymerase-3 subunit alpha
MTLVDSKRKNADSNQIDMFSILGETEKEYKYDIVKEYGARDKLIQEKEMLGMYVTGHPLSGYEKDFESFNFNTSMLPKKKSEEEDENSEEDYEEEETVETVSALTDNMDITTGGILSEVNIKRTKDGKEMAVCTLEDMYDRVELVAFSRTLLSCKKYLIKDTLVRVKGRINIRDGEVKIALSDIRPWELAEREEEETIDTRCLYLNITDISKMEKIDSILKAHSGKSLVKMQINKKIYQHNQAVSNLDTVAKELAGIIGGVNIKII